MTENEMMFDFIDRYAKDKELTQTIVSLKLVRDMMGQQENVPHMNIDGIIRFRGHYGHALQVGKILINLQVPVDKEEEDIMLSAALCHVIPNVYDYEETKNILLNDNHMDPRVCEIISLIINDTDLSAAGQKNYYDKIKANRLALVVFVADRANIVQQLHDMSIWSAREYIFETRSLLLPLCIDAKEMYPELLFTINILMEKVRTVVDTCMILLSRYETREMELAEDILNYQEENSRIRGIIQRLKKEQI